MSNRSLTQVQQQTERPSFVALPSSHWIWAGAKGTHPGRTSHPVLISSTAYEESSWPSLSNEAQLAVSWISRCAFANIRALCRRLVCHEFLTSLSVLKGQDIVRVNQRGRAILTKLEAKEGHDDRLICLRYLHGLHVKA